MKIIYGTSNKAKVENLRKIFKKLEVDIDLETLSDIGFNEEIIENRKDFWRKFRNKSKCN